MKGPSFPLYRWFRQGIRNPVTRQWVIAGVLVYLVSPIDIVPSFFPGVGEIDDVVLLGLLLSELVQLWWGNQLNPEGDVEEGQAETQKSTGAGSAASSQVVDIEAVAVDE
ncbi:MAG: YkvA family protein [Synechococcus sp.]